MTLSAPNTAFENLHLPRWEELPDFDLYMDQVIGFLNQTLDPINLDEGKPVLTPNMVNNYVKNSIVKRPVRKHYRRYHVAYLIVVLLLKRCFSLSEIASFIRIYSNIEDQERIGKDYNKFVGTFEDAMKEIIETGSIARSYFDNPTPQQALMESTIKTICHRLYTQLLLEQIENRAETETV